LSGPSTTEIYRKIEEIQADLEKIDPEFFNKFPIKKLNENDLKNSNATEYLEKLSDFIEKRSKDVKNLIYLQSKVIVLYEILKGFLT
jgi:hypothetical protein